MIQKSNAAFSSTFNKRMTNVSKERATYVLNEPAEVTFFVFNQSAFVSSYSAVIMRPLI